MHKGRSVVREICDGTAIGIANRVDRACLGDGRQQCLGVVGVKRRRDDVRLALVVNGFEIFPIIDCSGQLAGRSREVLQQLFNGLRLNYADAAAGLAC